MPSAHSESHLVERVGWLRAAVLGANDGIVSTSSLIVGVAAASTELEPILLAGTAGLVAGAMSMAAGEYISVSAQADTENADLARESRELKRNPGLELAELASLYEERGVEPATARAVAEQLTARDALGAHARDELGINEIVTARPIQAAFTSAATFIVGAALPLASVFVAPEGAVVPVVAVATLVALVLLGFLGARTGGANVWRGIGRVVLWGAVAMAVTAAIGGLFDVAVS